MLRIRRVLIPWLGLAGLVGALLGPSVVSADAFSSWTPGPGAALDDTYDGFIDEPTMNATVPMGGFAVAGWFADRTAQGWAGADDVQIWQGTIDGGGKMLAEALFAQSRPDVAAALGNLSATASGFNGMVPANSLSAGGQTLSVYAHTAVKGWWYKQVQVNVSTSAPALPAPSASAPPVSSGAPPVLVIEKPAAGENIKTKPLIYSILGYALDTAAGPNQGSQGSGIDHVTVYAYSEHDNGGFFIGEADLGFSDDAAAKYGTQFANAGWRLDFKPTSLKKGGHTLFFYAHSAVTGKEDLERVDVNIIENG